jgi:hypothetical protein
MEVRQYIRPDVTVSAIVHLSLVAIVVIYTEVHPFRQVVEKAVPVDVIVADEKKPEPLPTPTPTPSPDFSLLDNQASQKASSAPTPQAASPPPAQQAAAPASRREASAQPQLAPAPPAPQASAPAYTAPEPDLTIKYHVMLGLPEALPQAASAGAKRGEGGDADAATTNLASSLVDALRRHLKTCSKLPAALSPSDNVAVKLRVQMTPEGRLAAEPALIEGTASLKGVELMRGAIAALSACQPYAMLPADRYGEWKVLDLSFTPRDFNS